MKKFLKDVMTEDGKIRSLTKYVVFSIAMLLLYTLISILYQIFYGQELSNTLTTCFFSAFGGEILLAAFIKIFKIKNPNSYFGYSESEDEFNEENFDRE